MEGLQEQTKPGGAGAVKKADSQIICWVKKIKRNLTLYILFVPGVVFHWSGGGN